MAKRLALDDAIMRMNRDYPEAADVTQDLPMYVRDRQETIYLQQARGVNQYLCGKRVSLALIKTSVPRTSSWGELCALLVSHGIMSEDQAYRTEVSSFHVYPRAELSQVVHSFQLSSSTVSESYWVLVKPVRRETQYVGKVQYFFTTRNEPDSFGSCGTFYAVVEAYKTWPKTVRDQQLWLTYKDNL